MADAQKPNSCRFCEKREGLEPELRDIDKALIDAALGVLDEVYIGNGKMVCPPALVEPLRKLVRALEPFAREEK